MPTADEELSRRIEQIAEDLPEYREDLQFAFGYLSDDPRGSLTKIRLCTERLILDLYREIKRGSPPQKGDPIEDPEILRYLGPKNRPKLRFVRDLCNSASHVDEGQNLEFNPDDARDVLDGICDLLDWRVQDLRLRSRARSRAKRQGESSEPGLRVATGPLGDTSDESSPSRVRRRRRSYGWWLFGGFLIVGGVVALSLLRSSGSEIVRSLIESTVSGSLQTSLVSESSPADGSQVTSGASTEAGVVPAGFVPQLPSTGAVDQATRNPAEPAPPALTANSRPAEAPPTAGPDDADWTRQNGQTKNPLYAVTSDPDGRVYAVGDQGLLLVTTDGGRIWRRIQTNTKVKLFAVAAFSGGGVFAVGEAGTIIQPSSIGPGGLSFSARQLKQAFGAPLWAAYANSPDEWFVGGEKGTLVQIHKQATAEKRLLDDSWSPVTILSLTARDKNVLYASGNRGAVLRGERSQTSQSLVWSQVASPQILASDTFWQVGEVSGQLLLIGDYTSPAPTDGGKVLKQGLVLRSSDGKSFHREIFASKPLNPLYSFVQMASGDVFASAFVQKASYGIRSLGVGDAGIKWNREEVRVAGSALPPGKYSLGSSKFGDLFLVGPGGIILHKRISPRSVP